jgi:hypothetical protein
MICNDTIAFDPTKSNPIPVAQNGFRQYVQIT